MSLALPPGADEGRPEGLAARIATALKAQVAEAQSPSAILAELDGRRAEGKRASSDRLRLLRENIAFLEGIQHIQSLVYGLLNVGGLPRGRRVLVTDNRLGDHAKRLFANLQRTKYAPAAAAETDVPEDRKAAKAITGALRSFYRRQEVPSRKRAADRWLVATGHCYLEPYYDPEAGPEALLPVLDTNGEPVMEPALDDAGQPMNDETEGPPDPTTGQPTMQQVPRMRPTMELQRLGTVDFVVRSEFEVVRDPRFQDWRRIKWAFVEEAATPDDIVARYGKALEAQGIDLRAKLPEGGGKVNPLPWIPALAPGTEDITGLPKPLPAVSGITMLVRYYEKPGPDHPNGRHIVYVDGTSDLILHSGPLPRGRMPLFPLSYDERPWVLEGKTPVSEGKTLQRLFNRIFSRFGDHLVRMPAGWLMIPTNSGIPKNAFTSEVGSVIRHTPGTGKPDFIFPPFGGLQWYDRFLMRLEASFEERFHLPPAARGIMPKGARAARTVQLLQEAADEVNVPILDGLADGWRPFYEEVVELMREHYTVARLVAIEGRDKRAEILAFKGTDIPGDWRERIAINVEMGESLPRSRSAKWDVILTLARDHGFFGKAGTPDYVRKLRAALELDAGFVQTEEDLDAMIAEDENLQMLHSSQALPVRRIDDDWVHLVEHLTFAKGLIARGEEGRAAPHIQHADLHWAQFATKQGKTPQIPARAEPSRVRRLRRSSLPEETGVEAGAVEPEGIVPGQEPQEAGPPGPPGAAAGAEPIPEGGGV